MIECEVAAASQRRWVARFASVASNSAPKRAGTTGDEGAAGDAKSVTKKKKKKNKKEEERRGTTTTTTATRRWRSKRDAWDLHAFIGRCCGDIGRGGEVETAKEVTEALRRSHFSTPTALANLSEDVAIEIGVPLTLPAAIRKRLGRLSVVEDDDADVDDDDDDDVDDVDANATVAAFAAADPKEKKKKEEEEAKKKKRRKDKAGGAKDGRTTVVSKRDGEGATKTATDGKGPDKEALQTMVTFDEHEESFFTASEDGEDGGGALRPPEDLDPGTN